MAAKKKTTRTRPRDDARSLVDVPARALQAELRRRERDLNVLRRKRVALERQIAVLDKRIDQHEAAGVPQPRKRPRNAVILVDALKKELDDCALTVTAAAAAVQKAGYKTTSANFRTIVNQTLLAHKRTFKKVSRGTYTVKKK